MKNGYWVVADGQGIRPVGWGDLSFGDLEVVAAHVGIDETFVVVHERAGDNVWAAGIAEASARLDADAVASRAVYAITTGAVRFVDHFEQANRRGAVWLRPGYRRARTGRVVRAAPRRVMAITPADLRRRLPTHADSSTTPTGSTSGPDQTIDVIGAPADIAGESAAATERSGSYRHPSGCS